MNFLLLSATIVAAVSMVQGQQSTAERLGIYKNALFQLQDRQPNTNYFVSAVDTTSVLPQLMITDDEANEACRVWAPSLPTKYTGHPKTCSANLICNRIIDDPFSPDGHVYMITVYITPVAKGLFWSGNGSVYLGPNTACSSDPCVTNKAITDGLSCYSYISCVRSGEDVSYVSSDCPVGQGFDVEAGICVADSTCQHPQASNDFNELFCNQTTPPIYYAGVDRNSYYNRTIQYDNGTIVTLPNEYCSASLVLDVANLPACNCILDTNADCPATLVRFARDANLLQEGGSLWSSAPPQDGSFSVQDNSNPAFVNMARFSGAANSYYVAGGVNGNDMANNFDLSFTFALAQTSYPMSLVSNSRTVMNTNVCGSPTIDVYINQNGRVVADVVTFDGPNSNEVTLSVTSNTQFSVNQAVNVSLRRHEGYLKLSVNNENEVLSSGTFDFRRVKSTNCGLIFGTSGARSNNLNGWMDNVALYHDC